MTLSQQKAAQLNARIFADLVQGLARSICLTVEVFLRRGFGRRYVGCGFMGVVVIFFFAQCFPYQDDRLLYCYLVVYGILWLFACVNVLIRCWRGKNNGHSHYSGTPYLWRLLPSWKVENVKKLEALAVILLGYGVHYLNRPLGDYLMLAAALVFMRAYNLVVQQRDAAIQMNDRAIEQRQVAERFREMQQP
jgi:hypothetical protein